MKERRRFVRLDTRLPVVYRVLPSMVSVPSMTRDIAGEGICLFVKDALPPGTRLAVDIQLPDHPQPAAFEGEIVWCEEYHVSGRDQQQRTILGGVRFIEIAPATQEAIMRHVVLHKHVPSPTR